MYEYIFNWHIMLHYYPLIVTHIVLHSKAVHSEYGFDFTKVLFEISND